MIEGMKVTVSGVELAHLCKERSNFHRERVRAYEAQVVRLRHVREKQRRDQEWRSMQPATETRLPGEWKGDWLKCPMCGEPDTSQQYYGFGDYRVRYRCGTVVSFDYSLGSPVKTSKPKLIRDRCGRKVLGGLFAECFDY